MNINYIILAYDNPFQLKRLIFRLNFTDTWFYIHIDKKANRNLFLDELKDFKNITFVSYSDSENVIWADFTTVFAICKCLKLVHSLNENGYCILISEHDYPIKSNYDIHNFFVSNYGTIFMAANKLKFDIKESKDIFDQRISSYKFNLSSKKNDFVIIPTIWSKFFYTKKTFIKIYKIIKNRNFFIIFNLFVPRMPPFSFEHFWGSQWWAIPHENVNDIFIFIEKNPSILKYYKSTLAVDELFFHSILKNIEKKKEKKSIFGLRVTFMIWNKNESSPLILNSSNFEELISLPDRFLFARKFSFKNDVNILNLLDIYIDSFKGKV